MDVPQWLREAHSPLDAKLGLQLIEVTARRAVGRYPVEGNTQLFGRWHGGATCVAAETVASLAALAEVGPDGDGVVGVELNASHLRAVRGDWVEATASAVHIGRRLATYEVRLDDGVADDPVGVARVTVFLRRGTGLN